MNALPRNRRRPLGFEPLECRWLLAVGTPLVDIANPGVNKQVSAEFGWSTAADDSRLVVGSPRSDEAGIPNVGAAHVYDQVNGELLLTIANPTPAFGDQFGYVVEITGQYIAVSDIDDDVGANDAGTVFVFDALTGQLIQEFNNPLPAASDKFGNSIAMDGTTLVVGAQFDDQVASDAGAVYVFDIVTGNLVHTLTRTGGSMFDHFGVGVSIDSNRIAVGVERSDVDATDSGEVMIFNATTGALEATLSNPSPNNFDYFGHSVSLSGNRIAVGAHRDSTAQVTAGSVYVFDVVSEAVLASIPNPNPHFGDQFGFDLDLFGDHLLVGAFRDDTGARDAGRAYQFNMTNFQLTHTYDNPTPDELDYFGRSVSISATTAVVGSYWDDTAAFDSGSAYQFDAVTGSLRNRVETPTLSSYDYFGYSLAVGDDRLAVGAPFDDTSSLDAGHVQVLDLAGNLLLDIDNPQPHAGDNFGKSLALEGNILVVAADRAQVDGLPGAGAVFLFDLISGSLLHTLTSPLPGANDQFGSAVAIADGRVIVGAVGVDQGSSDSGAAYVFDVTSGSLQATLASPSGSIGDGFGNSVAVSSQFYAVGVAKADGNSLNDIGSVHLFDRATNANLRTIENPTPEAFDQFGFSLALQGTTLLIGAPGKNVGHPSSGSAYLYRADTGLMTAELINPVPAQDSSFGHAVALTSELAIIGAPRAQTTAGTTGAAFAFSAWTGQLEAPLTSAQVVADDYFGFSVSADSATLAIGSPLSDGLSLNRGRVSLFDAQPELAPVAIPGGPYTALEGEALTLDASQSYDPNQAAATLTYEWDLDYDGTTFDVDATGIQSQVVFPDDFVGQLALRVTDSSNLSTLATADLTIYNAAPLVFADASEFVAVEGDVALASGSITDVAADIVTLTADIGSVTDRGDGTWNWTYPTNDGPDQSQMVTITAMDDDGGASSVTFQLTVENVAPVVTANALDLKAVPHSLVQAYGLVFDQGNDSVTMSASWGDIVDHGAGSWTWSFTASSTGTFPLEISATDSDGATGSVNLTVTVSVISLALDSVTATEGTIAFNEGNYQLPEPGETVMLSANIGQVVDLGNGNWEWEYQTSDGPGSPQSVIIEATYSTNWNSSASFPLIVENAPPVLMIDDAVLTIVEGNTATNSGTVHDVLGDSISLTASIGAVTDHGDGTWDWTYVTPPNTVGTQMVTITATDDDGDFTESFFQLDLVDGSPTIDAISPTVTAPKRTTAENHFTVSDPNGDLVTVSASSGVLTELGDGQWRWSTTTMSLATRRVTITATDSRGNSTSVEFRVAWTPGNSGAFPSGHQASGRPPLFDASSLPADADDEQDREQLDGLLELTKIAFAEFATTTWWA